MDSQTHTFTPLTRFPVGSFKEMSYLAIPLMMSALSGALMLFFDRLILSHYSLNALNTAAAAGVAALTFHLGAIGIAGICEVYVGQNFGAKKYNEVGKPVWQMLWFSLFTALIFVPLSFVPSWFLPERYTVEGAGYFQVLMLAGPIVAANAALSGFFVGQGRVRIITSIVIIANILNVLLDIWFIFGWGPIPSMGTTGAALATALSQGVQFLVLFGVFLSKHNRLTYGTNRYRFDFQSFFRAFKVGFPSAGGHMIEITAWNVQFHLVALVSEMHVAVLAIGQTIFILVAFTTEGLQKGVIACSSNLVGAKDHSLIPKTLRSAFKLHLLIGVLFVMPLLVYPDWLIDDFISRTENNLIEHAALLHYTKLACLYILVYYVVDGLVWITAGLLTAIEDTYFIMIANAVNAWLVALVPLYVIVNMYGGNPDKSWLVIACYGTCNMICFLWRYKSKFKVNLLG